MTKTKKITKTTTRTKINIAALHPYTPKKAWHPDDHRPALKTPVKTTRERASFSLQPMKGSASRGKMHFVQKGIDRITFDFGGNQREVRVWDNDRIEWVKA